MTQLLRRAWVTTVVLSVVTCVTCITSVEAAPATNPASKGLRAGSYRGLVDIGGELHSARVEFERAGSAWRAQARIDGGEQALPATVRLSGPQLTLDLPGPSGPLRCHGVVEGPAIQAESKAAGCRLELVAGRDTGLATRLTGLWTDDDGRAYAISRSGDSPATMWLDYQTGAWRQLGERDGALHAGPAVATPWPEVLHLEPQGADLRLLDGSRTTSTRLQRVPLTEREIGWPSDDAMLKGTLLLPPGAGPFPAVVLTQMSSPATREGYREFAYFFVAQGIAALIYDRRGNGESSGSEGGAGMLQLADDAARAVNALAALPEIDARRIGTWGHSQGGWVAPIAATRSAPVSFVIAQSASGVSPALQEIFRVEHNARDAGLGEQEVAEAVDYETRLMNWARSGEGRDEIHALSKQHANARWAKFVELQDQLPDKPGARSQSFWWFDPAPELAKLRVPVLVIHGDRDGHVPVQDSVPILKRSFDKTRAAFHLLPRTAHGLWVGDADAYSQAMRSPGLHPDYWPLLGRWLRQQALVRPDARRCAAMYQAHLKTDLTLGYEAFDQTEGQGFRVLDEVGCSRQAADLIEAYLKTHSSKEPSLVWHVAQLRASAGQTAEAIVAAKTSIDPKEDLAKSPFRWNDYVLATIAFLERDKVALQHHRDRVAEGREADMGNAMNLKLLDALVKHFDASYDFATSHIGE